jgi:hypothetical protein
MMGTFNRLASGEEMPAREKIRPGSPEAAGCAGRGRHPHRRCRYPHQEHRRPSQWAAPLLWLVITLSLITVGLVFSRIGSPGKCAVQLAMICSHPDAAHSLYPAVGNGS